MDTIYGLPTPLQILADPASMVIIGIFLLLLIGEELFPGRPLPRVRAWKVKGILFFLFYFFFSTYLPFIWTGFLADHQLLNMTSLGDLGGAAVALLLYELGVFVWHRAMHKSNILWRVFHQMHHSAERIDTYGAFYFSPMDMFGFTFLTSLCMVWIGGFTPHAVIYAIYGATFLAVVQHANIKTPQWMGYIFQRPESHSLHHGKGIHAFNYSDLPLFDILFGTFKNPKEFTKENGFYNGASSRMLEMILFKDINQEGSDTR